MSGSVRTLWKNDTFIRLEVLTGVNTKVKGKGKVIPLQARCGPEGG